MSLVSGAIYGSIGELKAEEQETLIMMMTHENRIFTCTCHIVNCNKMVFNFKLCLIMIKMCHVIWEAVSDVNNKIRFRFFSCVLHQFI